MADQLARDLAWVLVTSVVPDYEYPRDLEVCFDHEPCHGVNTPTG